MPVPSWIDCAMATALFWSRRTKCKHHQVGCCIISPDGELLGEGYNGPVRGSRHCIDPEIGCAKTDGVGPERVRMRCRGTHAENNAIARASAHAGSLKGAYLVSTVEPCFDCAKAALNAGIARIFYLQPYRRVADDDPHTSEHENVVALCQEVGVAFVQYQPTRDFIRTMKEVVGLLEEFAMPEEEPTTGTTES